MINLSTERPASGMSLELSPPQVIAESENTAAVKTLAVLSAAGSAGGTLLEIFDSGFYPVKFPVSEVRSSFYDEADYCLDATGWIPTGSYCTRPSLYQDFLNVFAETLRDVS